MSTHAFVAIENPNQTITGIYLHSDGYPNGIGKILLESYNTKETAKTLVEMGYASAIHNDLDLSTFYCRDRNEDWYRVQPRHYDSVKDAIRNRGYSYAYLFRNDEWMIMNVSTQQIKPLKELV